MSARSPLAGRKATVLVERGGASIRIDDVAAADAGLVLADLLAAFAVLQRKHPDIAVVPDLTPVSAGTPCFVPDEDAYVDDKRRRIGY